MFVFLFIIYLFMDVVIIMVEVKVLNGGCLGLVLFGCGYGYGDNVSYF